MNNADDKPYQRWRCPGRHCGQYSGYQRGCRKPECLATVAPYKRAKRAQAGKPPRVPVDKQVKTAIIAMLSDGHSMTEIAGIVGVSDFRIRSARRNDPEFDAAVLEASRASGRAQPVKPLRPLECPGSDCTGRGYVYGCRKNPCSEAHKAAMADRAKPASSPLQRFDQHERYLAELRAGWTVEQAAERIGYEYTAVYYARLTNPDFDKQVIAAAAEGAPHGRPGPKPRAVHQLPSAQKRTT